MIEINLLPEELQAPTPGKFQHRQILYFIPAVFIILIIVHIFLGMSNIFLGFKYTHLSQEWKKLQPQAKQIEEVRKEYNSYSQDITAIEQFVKQRVTWAEKLNLLSRNLPSGVWFNEIFISNKQFILRGSVLSLEKQELTIINKFLTNLKNDSNFFGDFIKLELGPLKKDNIAGYDVLNFSLEGTLR